MHGIPCTFDAFLTHTSRPIARVSFDRTNYARSIEQLCVRDQRLSYTLHYDVDRYIIHFDKSKIWKRVNFERIFCKPLSIRNEIFAFSNFVREIRT